MGEKASVLKLGLIFPLPEQMIRDFAQKVDKLYVIEELDDIFETQVKKLGIACEGKNLFTKLGRIFPANDCGKNSRRKNGLPHF